MFVIRRKKKIKHSNKTHLRPKYLRTCWSSHPSASMAAVALARAYPRAQEFTTKAIGGDSMFPLESQKTFVQTGAIDKYTTYSGIQFRSVMPNTPLIGNVSNAGNGPSEAEFGLV